MQETSSSSSILGQNEESRNAKKRQSDDDHYLEVDDDSKPKKSRNIRFTYHDGDNKIQAQEDSNLKITLRRNSTSNSNELTSRRSSRSSNNSEKRKSYSEVGSDDDNFDDCEDNDNKGNDRYSRSTRTSSRTATTTSGISLRRRNNVNYNEDEMLDSQSLSTRSTRSRNNKRYNDDYEEEDDGEDEDEDEEDDFPPARSSRRTAPVRSATKAVDIKPSVARVSRNNSTYDNIISQAFTAPRRIDPDLRKKLLKLIRKVEEEDESALFASPVTDDIAPGYSKIIKEPMDFEKINSKFQNRLYENIDQLRDDMYKMFDNCEQYNEPDSCVVVEARRLRDIVDETIAEIDAGSF